jgi:hypothetical protein
MMLLIDLSIDLVPSSIEEGKSSVIDLDNISASIKGKAKALSVSIDDATNIL